MGAGGPNQSTSRIRNKKGLIAIFFMVDFSGQAKLKQMVGNDDSMMISISDFGSLATKMEGLANLICTEVADRATGTAQ